MFLFSLSIFPEVELLDHKVVLFWILIFFFAFFRAVLWHTEVPRLGVESELQLPACTTTPQQCQIQATCVTYTTADGHARSLTHWTRSGIEPTSLWRQHCILNLLSHNGYSLYTYYLNSQFSKTWKFINDLKKKRKFYFILHIISLKNFPLSAQFWNTQNKLLQNINLMLSWKV